MHMKKEIYGMEASVAAVPVRIVDDFLVRGEYANGAYRIPLATREDPLWPSVRRGVKALNLSGGVETRIIKDEMTRAPLFSAEDEATAHIFSHFILSSYATLRGIGEETTKYGKVTSISMLVKGPDVHMRIGMSCGDAAGHNMTEKAADAIAKYLVEMPEFRHRVQYLAVSGNCCVDKKPSRLNAENGRGKHVRAEANLTDEVLRQALGTTAEKIHTLNLKKNIRGSELAGTYGAQNAHHANMIAAIYLATGQDVANVVEGSQGRTETKIIEGGLEFCVDLPCIIVGTVGNIITEEYARKHLQMMQCMGSGNPVGANAKRLSELVAATVLAGELSLLAALTKEGELVRSHMDFERGSQ
jgi:hydroxymethylglutaryl-CoA reductase (NADPH)